jgi:putative ABC transport system permease protein
MTYLQLARRNAWRKPFRTILLVLCVTVAFVIYGLTASFLNGTQGATGTSESLLTVLNKAGREQPLPIAYINTIAADKDVAAVAYMSRLRGYFRTEENIVAINAMDPEQLLRTNGEAELGITAAHNSRLRPSRDRVLVGRSLALAEGWSVGQRIEITASRMARMDGSRNWSFEIAGIFDGADANTDTYFAIAQYDYINVTRARGKDSVDGFVVRPAEGASPAALAARIDKLFANSLVPTRTQSEKQFVEAFLRQFADVSLIVTLVVGAAFVTILMIVANSMLFAVRERTFEIGLLKTLGFSQKRIMGLVLSETLLIVIFGGLVGVLLTKIATLLIGPALGLTLTVPVLIKSVAIMIALGLLTGLPPAVHAMRTTITKTLRAR